jgi:hypothetical protein
VVGAEKLVVQNLQASRPPFRLRSTWPDGGVHQRREPEDAVNCVTLGGS